MVVHHFLYIHEVRRECFENVPHDVLLQCIESSIKQIESFINHIESSINQIESLIDQIESFINVTKTQIGILDVSVKPQRDSIGSVVYFRKRPFHLIVQGLKS